VAIWSQHGRVAVVVLCCVVLSCVVLWSCCCDAYGDALCGGLSVWAGRRGSGRRGRRGRRGPWPVGRQLGASWPGQHWVSCARPPPTAHRPLHSVCTLHSALCALRWSGLCRACRLAIDSEMRCRLGAAMMASSSSVVSRAADYAATSAGTAEAQCKRSAAVFVVRAPLATCNGNGARHSRPSRHWIPPARSMFRRSSADRQSLGVESLSPRL
jgi:hypothetical protein